MPITHPSPQEFPLILHITSRPDWNQAQSLGEYRAASLESEGFIHASTERQVIAVANAFYRGKPDLALLVIDESRLTSELRWEPPAGPPVEGHSSQDKFPHIYGPLNLDAVVRVLDLKPASAGGFSLPRLEPV